MVVLAENSQMYGFVVKDTKNTEMYKLEYHCYIKSTWRLKE